MDTNNNIPAKLPFRIENIQPILSVKDIAVSRAFIKIYLGLMKQIGETMILQVSAVTNLGFTFVKPGRGMPEHGSGLVLTGISLLYITS